MNPSTALARVPILTPGEDVWAVASKAPVVPSRADESRAQRQGADDDDIGFGDFSDVERLMPA